MRLIIDFGEYIANFFAKDLQNIYYHFLFLHLMKSRIKNKKFSKDVLFSKEVKSYWKQYAKISTIWHEYYYSQNGIKDVKYLPENLYYSRIEPFYNKKEFAQAIDDKNYYSERFKGVNHTVPIIRNISGLFYDVKFNLVTYENALSICKAKKRFVVKPSIDGSGGNRVFLFDNQINNQSELQNIFKKLEKNFVVEEVLIQHPQLAEFNKSSVNTIRFISFLNQTGVEILSSVLRMGGINSFTDNFSTGGIACGIDLKTGKTKKVAYDQQYNKYEIHPNGYDFTEKTIVGYFKAANLVEKLHLKFGHFRIISWDIVINEKEEPTILEFNFTPQSIDFHQICNGPLFGELTDIVLQEVFN